MADITDGQVIDFAAQYMRPLAEKLRDLQLFLTDAKTEYTTIIAPILAGYADGDVLQHGYANIYKPTKSEMADLLVHINAVLTTLDTAGQDALRAKFTVRPPSL